MSDYIHLVLDMGYDYGASGGPDAFDTRITVVGSSEIALQLRSQPIGEWQLGSREILRAKKDYLLDFWHTVRGQAHSFAFRDWNDFAAEQQALALDGTVATQLIKSYGGLAPVDDYVANVTLPKLDTLLIERSDDAEIWTAQEAGTDYTVSDTTGVITWLGTPPAAETFARWSGEFYKRVRFGVARFTLQFLGYEQRGPGTHEAVYMIGPLTVREVLV